MSYNISFLTSLLLFQYSHVARPTWLPETIVPTGHLLGENHPLNFWLKKQFATRVHYNKELIVIL